MKRGPQIIGVSNQRSPGGLCEIRHCVLRVPTRTLDAGIKELRLVGPHGPAAIRTGHLVPRRPRRSVQRVH